MDLYEFENATGSRPEAHSNDATTGTSSGANANAAVQPSLNDEVQQAIGVLGSWWGGFRKQSTVVLSSARKDFGQVVQQAQKEIGKLSAARTSSEVTDATSAASPTAAERKSSEGGEASAARGTSPPSSPRSGHQRGPSSPTAMLFSFLPQGLAQNLSAAPGQIQTTLQRTLSNPEVQNLRSTITTNLSNLQSTVSSTVQSSVQSVQANPQVQNLASSVQSLPASVGNLRLNAVEGFVLEKGEEFWKGAGEFFREAVKIVPPTAEELAARERMVGVGAGVFDGAGVWMFDDLGGDVKEDLVEEGKGKGKAGAGAAGVGLSRTAMLLKQLRGEPDLLRVDPSAAGEGKSGETFEWFLKELEGKGVTVGSDAWLAKCAGEEAMFQELKGTKKTLVPAEMDDITFWKRYWFRTWQIREAEEKRKALLRATAQNEEVFAWDEEEEAPSRAETVRSGDRTAKPKSTAAAVEEITKRQAETASGKKPGPTATSASASSPRESSEDSYDLVSTRSGNASGVGIAAPPVLKGVPEAGPSGSDEEGDSDEEEDEEEDDEDDDEEEDDEDDEEDDEDEETKPKDTKQAAAKPGAAQPAEEDDDSEEESEGSDWE